MRMNSTTEYGSVSVPVHTYTHLTVQLFEMFLLHCFGHNTRMSRFHTVYAIGLSRYLLITSWILSSYHVVVNDLEVKWHARLFNSAVMSTRAPTAFQISVFLSLSSNEACDFIYRLSFFWTSISSISSMVKTLAGRFTCRLVVL